MKNILMMGIVAIVTACAPAHACKFVDLKTVTVDGKSIDE